MDNMKPLIDAVSEDRREEAATDDEAGRPDCHGARQGGQRGSSCGRHGRSGPPPWVGMMSHMGPPCGSSWGPSCGQSCGPPYGPSGMSPCGPPCRPPCRSSCGPPYGHPGGPPFMHGSSGFGPVQCPLGRGPPFMNGPPQCACPWDRGMAPMNYFGPMPCPWGTHPPWADETVDDENDKKHAGKQNAKDAGEETHDPQQQDGADCEKSGQQCPGCPWGDGMRRRKMRHANVDCRRHDPYPMSVNCRCRRRCGARSHCPPWSTVPGDCCQPGAPMGWSGCPYPLPFFGPFACDSAGESNSDPENDNQKQDGDQETPKAFCPFSQGPTGFGDRWRPCCQYNGRGWQCGPPRNKLYEMLSWKRKVLKEKLQRIESHLERLRPSEEETKEAATGEDAGPEQASSMSTAPEAASPMDTHGGETGERGWEVIDDSE